MSRLEDGPRQPQEQPLSPEKEQLSISYAVKGGFYGGSMEINIRGRNAIFMNKKTETSETKRVSMELTDGQEKQLRTLIKSLQNANPKDEYKGEVTDHETNASLIIGDKKINVSGGNNNLPEAFLDLTEALEDLSYDAQEQN